MILLSRVLGEKDIVHVRAILAAPEDRRAGAAEARAKARKFLEERTYVARGTAPAFRALAQSDRERLISDLVWRITCHLEGSVTRVAGVNTFDLGSGFCAILSELDGRDIFCLVRSTGT